jgi:hypothetical protein
MMTRLLALPMLLLLAACSGLAPAKTEATAFENAQTGQRAAGCGQAWQAKGWVPLNKSIAALPE